MRYTRIRYAWADPVAVAGGWFRVSMVVEVVETSGLYELSAGIAYVSGPSTVFTVDWYPGVWHPKGIHVLKSIGLKKGEHRVDARVAFPEKGLHTLRLETVVFRHNPRLGRAVYEVDSYTTRYVVVVPETWRRKVATAALTS